MKHKKEMLYKISGKNGFYIFNIIANLLFSILTIFFAAGGHGTYFPLAIFFGFFSIPFFISSNLHSFALPLVFQILIYSLMFNFLLKNKNLKYFFLLPIFHIFGILAATIFCIDEFHRLGVYESLATYHIAFLLIVIYWISYFKLLSK